MKGYIKRWAPLFAWVVLIFSLSSIPKLSIDHPVLPANFDKAAHFIEYMILAVFFYRGLCYDKKTHVILSCLFVVLCGTGIAAMDEIYQSWIPGRDSNAMDFLADLIGVVAGILIALFRYGTVTEKVEGV